MRPQQLRTRSATSEQTSNWILGEVQREIWHRRRKGAQNESESDATTRTIVGIIIFTHHAANGRIAAESHFRQEYLGS